MSLTLVYGNRSGRNPPVFFTPLDGKARADLFKIIKVYQGLKSLCKSFVGAAILSSTDGTKMAVYEQWKEETDFNELADPVAHPEMVPIRKGSDKIQHSHEHKNMEFVTGECNPQLLPAVFTTEQVMHFEVFKTQPNRFEALLAQCLASMKQKLSHTAGFLAYSIHRTLDGTKLCIVGHWRNSEDAAKCLEQDNDSQKREAQPVRSLYTDRTAKMYEAIYVI